MLPPEVAAKVTVAFGTAFPSESFTTTVARPAAVPTVAFEGADTTEIEPVAETVTMVSTVTGGTPAIEAAAVTLPVMGEAKVTAMPETPLPNESATLTTKGCRSPLPTVPVWPEPETAAMLAAAPAVPVALNAIGDPASVPELAVNV